MRPFGLHRRHSYESVPARGRQSPVSTPSVEPGLAEPLSVGAAADVTAGYAGATGPKRLEYAEAVPVESVARTVKPSVLPESAGTVWYVVFVAPRIAEQCAPSTSQRYHWYLYVSAPTPAHRPTEPVSRTPRLATPRIAGGTEWEGPATSPPIATG